MNYRVDYRINNVKMIGSDIRVDAVSQMSLDQINQVQFEYKNN